MVFSHFQIDKNRSFKKRLIVSLLDTRLNNFNRFYSNFKHFRKDLSILPFCNPFEKGTKEYTHFLYMNFTKSSFSWRRLLDKLIKTKVIKPFQIPEIIRCIRPRKFDYFLKPMQILYFSIRQYSKFRFNFAYTEDRPKIRTHLDNLNLRPTIYNYPYPQLTDLLAYPYNGKTLSLEELDKVGDFIKARARRPWLYLDKYKSSCWLPSIISKDLTLERLIFYEDILISKNDEAFVQEKLVQYEIRILEKNLISTYVQVKNDMFYYSFLFRYKYYVLNPANHFIYIYKRYNFRDNEILKVSFFCSDLLKVNKEKN
jgi:hypothetical protein